MALPLALLVLAGCTDAPQQLSAPAPPASHSLAAAGNEPRGGDAEDRDDNVSNPHFVPLADARFIDLTHPFDETTVYWPTGEGFQLEVLSKGMTEKGYYYSANQISAAEHGGTHLDAPIHFYKDGRAAQEIPLSQLIGEGVVVDVSEKCAKDRDYQIGVADLRAWEEKHERQLVDVIVLLRTGFSRHWPDEEKYLGTGEKGPAAVAKLHFPGLAPEAAKWLLDHRAIQAVGIDTASIDYGQSELFESHVALCRRNTPIFENVAALDELPPFGFTIIALPMKIAGGSGGPLRIVAAVPEK